MRLRLAVRRHGIPEVKLLWTVGPNTDLTISKLLVAVNEVVPLESGEWGLEDYAVEYRDAQGDGFECLHFQVVRDILKEDDQLLIRPLLEDDLRRRRISGRHQISVDGRHLVDGVAFGRPWLKAPANRPAIELPPRKRARIDYDLDDEYDDEEEDTDYDDYAEDEDEEGEDDFSSLEAEEDTEAGDQLLLEAPGSESSVNESTNVTPQLDVSGAANSGSLKRGRVLGSSPVMSRSGSTNSTPAHRSPRLSTVRFLSPKASESHHSLNPAKRRKLENRLQTPLRPKASRVVDASIPIHATPDKEPASSKGAESESNEPCPVEAEVKAPTPEDPVRTTGPESSSDSGDSTVSLSSLARSKGDSERQENSNDGEAQRPTAVNEDEADKGGHVVSSGSSLDDDSGSDSDSDSSSEDFSSSDDSASDANGGVNSDGSDNNSDSDSDNSSDSDSSDSSDLSESSSDGSVSVEGVGPRDSVAQREHGAKAQTTVAPVKKVETVAKKVPVTSTPFTTVTPHVTIPSGNVGQVQLSRSQKRNMRRRLAKLKNEQQNVGSPTATGTAAPADTGSAEVVAELLRRKQALLESIGAENSSPASVNPLKRKASDIEETPAKASDCDGALATARTNGTTESETAATRKLRLDLGAGRRLLFGALGVRNPKTREEEGRVRDALAKHARPVPTARTEKEVDLQDKAVAEPPEDEDPDAWRRKINYRAVECCREGIELSEPPFPFVQRWDPQQRPDVWFGNNKKTKRGGKGKKKLRNQAHYYDAGYDVVDETQLSYTAAGGATDSQSVVPPEMGDTVMEEPNDLPRPAAQQDKNTEATADATEDVPESRDDLPVLPDDLSTLAPLLPGAATPGMVITWKKWLLSKATQWQPQVSNVTAVVAKVDNADANTLKVFLAKRDRPLDKPEKDYDPETGERIYDGFEAPDTDEDGRGNEGEDDGERTVTFAEMMDPRVVQPALPPTTMFGSSFAGQLPDEDGVGYLQDSIESRGGDATDSNEVIGDATEPMSLDLQVPFSDPVESVVGEPARGLPPSSPATARTRALPPSSQPPQMSGENSSSLRVPVTEYPSQNTTSLDVLGNLSMGNLSAAGSVASGRGQVDPTFVGVESYDSQKDAIPDSAVALEGDAATEKEKNDDRFQPSTKLVSSSQPVLPASSAGQHAVAAPQTPKSSPEAPGRVLRAKETIRLPGSEASFFDGEQAELAREKSAKIRRNDMLKNLSASIRKNTNTRRLEETAAGGSPNNNNNVQRRIFSSSQSSAVPKIVKMEKLDLSERVASLSQTDSRNNAVIWGGGKKKIPKKSKAAVEKDVFEIPPGSQVIDLTSDGEGAVGSGGTQGTQGTQGSGGLTEGIPNGGGWMPKKKKERKAKAKF